LFEKIEKYYGKIFVQKALGALTVAKPGLSQLELEDILSCDDELLDDIFQYWVPPLRRFPTSIICRLWRDIGGYLVERGSEGVSVYKWYHRQFQEAAEERFVPKSNKEQLEQRHQALVLGKLLCLTIMLILTERSQNLILRFDEDEKT